MQRIKQLLLALPVAVIMATMTLAPVSAQDGTGTPPSTDGGTTNTSSTETTPPQEVERPQTTSTDTSGSGTQNETELHTQGQELLNQAEKTHGNSNKSKDQLEKVCDERKQGIENRTGAIVTHAQNSLSRINEVLTKVETFQKTNNLTVTNYDTLVAAATAAQTKAMASVQALVSLKPPVNCTDPSTVKTDLATFKAAVKQAHDDLVAYRTAVKNVLVAVETAKSSTTSATGGQQ